MTHKPRRFALALLLAAALATGCARSAEPSPPSSASPLSGAASFDANSKPAAAKAAITSRKLIRQAELELAVASPGSTQTEIERLAERRGGYVISATHDIENGSALRERVTVTVRVPEAQLSAAISEVKRLGHGTGSERITSSDVTDEYLDLGARLASQRQLELQYLEILKRAVTVKDALEVQKELAEVRTEIERLQGRQQFLAQESDFSTLSVHLLTDVAKVTVRNADFRASLQRARADALGFSADLINGGISLAGVLLPVLMLLLLPAAFLLWATRLGLRRLSARKQRANAQALGAR